MSKELTQGFSLSAFSCAVIGVGGLGCNIAVHLAGAGVGRLILCDYDTVGKSNLNRQFLYTCDDIGKSKAETARDRLKAFSPDSEISALKLQVGKDIIPGELKDCDMIFLAADNRKARKCVSLFCEENSLPLMLGGIDGFYGKTYLYLPGFTPTPERAGMLDAGRAEFNISSTAGIIGSLQASVGIQYLLTGDKSLGGSITVFDRDTFSTLRIK